MSLTTKQILALLTLPGIGPKTVLKLGNALPSPIEDSQLPQIVTKVKRSVDPQAVADALVNAESELQRAADLGIYAMSYYEPDFPEGFRRAVDSEGKHVPSVLFFYRGNRELLREPGVAVIGSRNAAEPALKASHMLSKRIAQRGITIVSGLALGCDTAAHEGALTAEGGTTIAVVGNGLDHVYPTPNKDLAARILAAGGLIISEYRMGTKATPATLISRDRLQTALSNAVLVAQSSANGGTMHAAKAAYHSGKPLYVVRYKDERFDNSPATSGNHLLLKEFGAEPAGPFTTSSQLETCMDRLVSKAKEPPTNLPSIQNNLF